MDNSAELFKIAKAIKTQILTIAELSSLPIWLFHYPAVTTLGGLVLVTHKSQQENFERMECLVDIALKDSRENFKMLLTNFELIEKALVGNMKTINDGDGTSFLILSFLPFGNRITEASADKVNLYHYRVFSATVIKTSI